MTKTVAGVSTSQPVDCPGTSGAGGNVALTSLDDADYTFTVAAFDDAGDVDPTPASRSWTVDHDTYVGAGHPDRLRSG